MTRPTLRVRPLPTGFLLLTGDTFAVQREANRLRLRYTGGWRARPSDVAWLKRWRPDVCFVEASDG